MTANPYFVDESKPWFSAEAGWPTEVPKNTTFEKRLLGDMLRETVLKYPDHTAIWFQGVTMSYRELDAAVDRFATALAALGLKKGDVLALLLPNSFQYVVAYYACARLGIIVSGCNPTYKPGEILHQLKTVGAKAMLLLDILYNDIVAPIRDEAPVKLYIKTNITDLMKLSPVKKILGGLLGKIPKAEVPNAKDFCTLMKTSAAVPKVEMTADDTATYIMTGGTTGVPKAAVLSHFNCVSNAHQCALWLYKIQPGAGILGVLPLFHSFAMTTVMNICVRKGLTMILFPKPPEMEVLFKTIVEVGPPQGIMMPGAEILFKKMAEFPGAANYDISGKLIMCVSGAGPLHRPVQEAFENITKARLSEGYGLTESTPVISGHPFFAAHREEFIGTIGVPFPGTDWRIVDINDPTVIIQPGEMTTDDEGVTKPKTGEIAAAGPQIMVGYLNRPDETAETVVEMDGKRWLLTGDIGYMDTHGRIIINDRKKQLIKNRGWSVFPTEVETLMMGHEAVNECAVAGIPDEQTGESIKAWVVLKPEFKGKVTNESLAAWAKENLTHYKVPRYVQIIEEIPKTPVGKVLRRELQEADPLFIEGKKKKKATV